MEKFWGLPWCEKGAGPTSPISGTWTSNSCQISGGIILEIKCSINVICLNHHEPPHPLSLKTLSPTKLVPGAKMVGDHCIRIQFF